MTTQSTTEECIHHWMLPAPSAKTTTGVCKSCGATKDFVDHQSGPQGRWLRQRGQAPKKPTK
jgi:hypothetical protein